MKQYAAVWKKYNWDKKRAHYYRLINRLQKINILVTYAGNGLVSCVNILTRCEYKTLCWFHINTWWRVLLLEKLSHVLKALTHVRWSHHTCFLIPSAPSIHSHKTLNRGQLSQHPVSTAPLWTRKRIQEHTDRPKLRRQRYNVSSVVSCVVFHRRRLQRGSWAGDDINGTNIMEKIFPVSSVFLILSPAKKVWNWRTEISVQQ